MSLSSNRAACKALVQTRAGKKKTQAALTLTVHKKTFTAVQEQWQCTQGKKTVTSKTWLYQQEKHLTAKAAPAIATRDFKQQLERGMWLAEKDP
jgi:hypothetical protein